VREKKPEVYIKVVADLLPKEANINVEAGEAFVQLWKKISDGLGDECDLYQAGGPEALNDRSPLPDRVWNRIPDDVRERIRHLALGSRRCRRGSWPCASPTLKAILCQKLRSTAC
jgi:hypothetical protein